MLKLLLLASMAFAEQKVSKKSFEELEKKLAACETERSNLISALTGRGAAPTQAAAPVQAAAPQAAPVVMHADPSRAPTAAPVIQQGGRRPEYGGRTQSEYLQNLMGK